MSDVEKTQVWNKLKTHCKQGHEFTKSNTHIRDYDGARVCRSCRTISSLRACLGKHKKLGQSKQPLYPVYKSMKRRCENKDDPAYKNYGGRGIKVCKKWLDDVFSFYKDMGPRPSKYHSLDRIDNDGNYEPSNCRWATKVEQMQNRRLKHICKNGHTRTSKNTAKHGNNKTVCLDCRKSRFKGKT